MLQIECEEYLQSVREAADKLGLRENLEEYLTDLETYACPLGEDQNVVDLTYTRCVLWKDFAPFSFYFIMEKKQKDGSYARWFNGGMIFYGAGETGVGAPQYSCRLGSTKAGWSINT